MTTRTGQDVRRGSPTSTHIPCSSLPLCTRLQYARAREGRPNLLSPTMSGRLTGDCERASPMVSRPCREERADRRLVHRRPVKICGNAGEFIRPGWRPRVDSSSTTSQEPLLSALMGLDVDRAFACFQMAFEKRATRSTTAGAGPEHPARQGAISSACGGTGFGADGKRGRESSNRRCSARRPRPFIASPNQTSPTGFFGREPPGPAIPCDGEEQNCRARVRQRAGGH